MQTTIPATAAPHQSKPRKRARFDQALLLNVAVAGLSFALPVPREGSIAGLPSPCLFFNVIGVPCPGCGLTRSFVCAAHGHWHEAFAYHLLGPPMLGALLAYLAWRLACKLGRAPRFALSPRARKYVRIASVAVFVGAWALRLSGHWPMPV